MEASPSPKKGKDSCRLEVSIVPIHYDLTYHYIDLERFVFRGTCQLHGRSVVDTTTTTNTKIQLHALELQIYSVKLVSKHENSTQTTTPQDEAVEVRYHRIHQTVDLIFVDKPIVPDEEYVLLMDFQGSLNDQMVGLYRSVYPDIHGVSRIMATTQFEATSARRAFPCMDEPALKATFQLTVTIPARLQCISNTPVADRHTNATTPIVTGSGSSTPQQTIQFHRTPKMSTYLVALVVGELDGIAKTNGFVTTTVYTVPGKATQAAFCLETATQCLDLYQQLFQVPYPLTKSDLVAIPDFAAGAMENWGCVTYREAKILVKPGSTSESTRRGIARTVCHELAHQWFGNLVTMEYWTQLYLKEGMARFMEFVGIDTLFPEWNAWTEFVQDVYGTAMGLDSMESSHPIEVEVHHPDEIAEIFDSISYAKGASIIRMIASHVGMDTFFDGMRLYLTRHAYGNTVTNDLWKALEEVSGKPVVMFMQAWTLESGYPILELWDDGTINVERYLAAGRNAIDSSDKPKTRWSIPVTARVEGFEKVQGPWVIDGPNGDEKDALSFKIKEWCEAGKWFKLNVDQTGFYRVRYSKKQSACLTAVMKPGSALTTIDRLGLISDSFAAGKAGYAQIADALELINSFGEHEVAEYPVWQELSENLASLATMIRSEPYFHRFQDLLRGLYSRQMDLLGWVAKSGEDSRTGTLRATTIGMLAIADDPCVLRKAYDEFMAFRRDPAGAPIAGDLQKTIFRCALKYDESTVYNELKQLYEKSSFPEEQRNCLSVLGCVKNSGLHREMLHYAFHSGNVRSQDIAFLLGSLATSTDEGGRASWKYFQDNFSILYTKYGSGPVWGTCVALSCRGLRTIIEADQVEEFFRDPSHSVGAVKRRLMQSLEAVRTMAVRRDRDRNALQEYFQ